MKYITSRIVIASAISLNKTIKRNKKADLIHDLNMLSFIDYECIKSFDIRIKFEYSQLTPIEFYNFRLKCFKDLLKTNVFISSKYKKYNTIAAETLNNILMKLNN